MMEVDKPEKQEKKNPCYRFSISLSETKGVVNYADLMSQERKKRHLLSNPPSDPSTNPTTTTTTSEDTPKTPPLNGSVDEASIDTAGDESVEAADESVEVDEGGNASASKDVKKSSPKRSMPVLPKKKTTNRLVQIIDKIEKMYTTGGDSFMNGYDTSDSFIDDSDMVEKPTEEVENEYGGFFVHSGELKTRKKKRVSDFQEDSPDKNKSKRTKKLKIEDEKGSPKEKDKKNDENGKKSKDKKPKDKKKEETPKDKEKKKEDSTKDKEKKKEDPGKEKEKKKEEKEETKDSEEEKAALRQKLLQTEEKIEQAIKELETEAKKKIVPGQTKRIPAELAPQLSNLYEALQQTANGFITDRLLDRLVEFLPFKKSTIKMHLKKSKHKAAVDTMEVELKRLEDAYDTEYNLLRAAVFNTMAEEQKKQQQNPPPTDPPADPSNPAEPKKYAWTLAQKNLLYDTLVAGYQIVDWKVQIAQERTTGAEGEPPIPSQKAERAKIVQKVLEIFPAGQVTTSELTQIYSVRNQARKKKEQKQKELEKASNPNPESAANANSNSNPSPSPSPSLSPSSSSALPSSSSTPASPNPSSAASQLMPPPSSSSSSSAPTTSPFFNAATTSPKIKKEKAKNGEKKAAGPGGAKPAKVYSRKKTQGNSNSSVPSASSVLASLSSAPPLGHILTPPVSHSQIPSASSSLSLSSPTSSTPIPSSSYPKSPAQQQHPTLPSIQSHFSQSLSGLTLPPLAPKPFPSTPSSPRAPYASTPLFTPPSHLPGTPASPSTPYQTPSSQHAPLPFTPIAPVKTQEGGAL
eukprot:Phypoly_transcript_03291.p1 GENE.Phypoly_transcript_03291~~Phypoly_transcript_03291.p1  ORF type:complete len:803 (+),score=285.89 Phypoly_transcript_03291:65-2473(+)